MTSGGSVNLDELKTNLFNPLVEALKETYEYRYSEKDDAVLTFFVDRCYVSIIVMKTGPEQYDNEAMVSYSDRKAHDGYVNMGSVDVPIENLNEIIDLVKGTLGEP